MSDMTPILDKIAKLLNLAANNPSQEEAASAAAKAQELMTTYNLDMAVIEKRQGKTDGQREDQKIKGGFYAYQRALYSALARLNFCMYWTETYWDQFDKPKMSKRRGCMISGKTRTRHRLIGRKVNTFMTLSMSAYLEEAIERALHKRLTKSGKVDVSQLLSRYANSFREGAVNNLIARIHEEREKGEVKRAAEARKAAAETGPRSRSTAVTVADLEKTEEAANFDFIYGVGAYAKAMEARAARMKEAREHREYMEKLEKEDPEKFAELEKEERKGQRRGRAYKQKARDYGAYYEGHDAADSISLNKQVGEDSAPQLGRD